MDKVGELQNRIAALEIENTELKASAKKWLEYHDAAAEDAKKWRKDAQELQGENERLHERLSEACFERNLAQIEVQTLKEALQQEEQHCFELNQKLKSLSA